MSRIQINSPIFFWLLILVLAAGSWMYFQPVHTYTLDSDMSIWILMTEHPHLPQGLYYWGQNRLGSLIPIIAHLLTYIGFSAIVAVSVVNLSFQVLSAWIVRLLTGQNLPALFMAFMLLFPPWVFKFMNHIGHPYTQQVFLWLLTLWIYKRYTFKNDYMIWVYGTLIGIQIWVSDISIALIPLFGLALWKFFPVKSSAWIKAFVALCIPFIFILILKNNTPQHANYYSFFADLNGLKTNLALLTRVGSYFTQISLLGKFASILVIIIAQYSLVKGKSTTESSSTLLLGVMLLLITLSSDWVARNEGLRYFGLPLTFILAGLLMRELKPVELRSNGILQLALVLSMSVFMFIDISYLSPDYRYVKTRPTRVEAEELARSVNYPLLGDYWWVYITTVFREDALGSAHFNYEARNQWDWNQIVLQDSISYVNTENPDTLFIKQEPFIKLHDTKPIGPCFYSSYVRIQQK